MAFDWLAFLRQNHIYYREPNSRGWVQVRCPLCGADDPSQHMNIHPRTGGWHCWRDPTHRGRDSAKLVQLLTGCSYADARALTGEAVVLVPSDDDLAARLRPGVLTDGEQPCTARAPSLAGDGLKPLYGAASPFAVPFRDYLRRRKGGGYEGANLDWAISNYELHYATKGPYAYRVVFPVRDRDGTLLTWTGRSIRSADAIRYLSAPTVARKSFTQAALVPIKQTLLSLPLLWECKNPSVLVVCEGPFDAMRITCFGRAFGVYATCLFGLTVSDSQRVELWRVASRFRNAVLLLDSTAVQQPLQLAFQQEAVPFRVHRLSPEFKDPGELTPQAAIDLCLGVSLDGSELR